MVTRFLTDMRMRAREWRYARTVRAARRMTVEAETMSPQDWLDCVLQLLSTKRLNGDDAARLATISLNNLDVILELLSRRSLDPADAARLAKIGLANLTPATVPETLVGACEATLGGQVHYSQEGEDVLVLRFLDWKRDGFFVDVGAHHAIRFSNTYALYRRGWRGVNIDATPGSMASFNALRPEDTNIEAAISDRTTRLIFHMFTEGALNTFDADLADSYIASGHALKERIELATRPLADVLDEVVPAGRRIDLLSVDVEGAELAVLQSNDWVRFAPEIIILEALETELAEVGQQPCIAYLAGKGYRPVSFLANSVILRHR